jgi:hypothetical protein
MRPKNAREVREFSGVMPKNQSILSRVRDHGYVGVMLNKEDFMDAVVWAANMVYEYKDFFAAMKRRIVIPLSELPYWKQDIINAHFIMLNYYNMKKNFVLLEEFKLSLYTIARFQEIAEEDIDVMKRWDSHIAELQQRDSSNDFNIPEDTDDPTLRGTEKKYEDYSRLVTNEIESFRAVFTKLRICLCRPAPSRSGPIPRNEKHDAIRVRHG